MFIFIALCLILAFLPLPYGSVEPWSIYIFEAATLILFGLHLVRRRGSQEPAENEAKAQAPFRIPLIFKLCLGLFFAVAILHVLPLPPAAVRFLSPSSAAAVGQDLGEKTWRALSLAPALSAYELLKYVCYFLFARLVFLYISSRRRLEIFVWVVLAGAVFQSLYGLEEYFGGTHRIFGWKNVYYADSTFGTFVNRNHFAGFLEMALPLGIGYLLAKADFFSIGRRTGFKERLLWFGQERLQKTVIHAVAPIILGLGLFFSRSRGGLFNFFLATFFMIFALTLGGKKGSGQGADRGGRAAGDARAARSRIIVRTVLLLIVGAALLIGINPILERFSADQVRNEGRPILYKYTLDLISHYPSFGTGPGTYVYAYPRFEKIQTPGLTDHAHNDYLELLAEMGVIGGGGLIIAAFGAFVSLFIRWTKRKDPFVKGISLGILAGILAILVHSFGDFNLRIPANAVYFASFFAVAMGALRSKF